MELATSYSPERSALRAGGSTPPGGISVKARSILEEAIASGQATQGTSRLVKLLREQDYSIAELLNDLGVAKALTGAAYPDILDQILIGCIDQTAVIHEAAIENMLHVFCELTVTGTILYANPAPLKLLPGCEGMPLDRYFPKHASDVLGALDGSSGRRVHRMELETPDCSRPVLADFGPVRRGVTAYAFIIDLTHAQEAERRAHDTAPFAILKIDPAHRITYANESASRLLGGTPQSVVGRDAGSLVQGHDDVDALEREYAKRRGGETSEYELGLKPINQQPSARVMVRTLWWRAPRPS